MKRTLLPRICAALLLITLLLCGCGQEEPMSLSSVQSGTERVSSAAVSSAPVSSAPSPERTRLCAEGEFRGVWLSYFEMSDLLKGKSEAQFRALVADRFGKVRDAHLNAVIVHVRPSSDAFYRSEIFPWSMYITGTQGKDPGFDPMQIMIETAHADGLEFHAWINPYRVGKVSNLSSFADTNPAKIWLTDGDPDNDRRVRKAGSGYYYNPAIPAVRKLIIDGVREIVEHYDVDAIHFDDYFYPTTDKGFDDEEYAAYRAEAGGAALSLDNWRREQVNALVRGVYAAVKAADERVRFGISPGARLSVNRDSLYADCALWMREDGYLDYICPQLYFGFEHPTEAVQFDRLIEDWSALAVNDKVALYLGLASYKIGAKDAGSTEWIDNDDVLRREIEFSRTYVGVDGFAFYSYSSLFGTKDAYVAAFNQVQTLFYEMEGDEP